MIVGDAMWPEVVRSTTGRLLAGEVHKLLVVDVEPVWDADEEEVRPDSSCWWRLSLFWRLRRRTSTRARTSSAAMAKVRVPMRARTDWALIKLPGATRCWMKSRMAELRGPKKMVEAMAGADEVCSKWRTSSGCKRT